jgi:hypothetical protein
MPGVGIDLAPLWWQWQRGNPHDAVIPRWVERISKNSQSSHSCEENLTDQLTHLLSYTIFHIGLYATVVAILIKSRRSTMDDDFRKRLNRTVFFFLVAGACGGVIAGSIPEHKNWEEFESAALGPFGLDRTWLFHAFNYSFWSKMEHGAFWVGVLMLVWTYRKPRTATNPPDNEIQTAASEPRKQNVAPAKKKAHIQDNIEKPKR